MVSLNRFDIFKAVVDAGSFSAAADTLGLTRAVVSFNVKRLEAELGVTLLIRNTRRLALTDAGERFYLRCVSMLEEARQAIEEARSAHAQLQGTLRLTTTVEYALARVVPALDAFRRLHPALTVHLSTSATHADLIAERFDVAIRLGRMDDSGYRAVPLASYRVVLVAAPALLASLPADRLDDYTTIMRLPRLGYPRLADLTLSDAAGTTLRYETAPADAPVTVDNAAVLRGFALLGQGVALLPQWLVQDDLDAGRLRQLLSGHRFAPQGVYALYPDTRHLPLKVRAFIDFMKAREAE